MRLNQEDYFQAGRRWKLHLREKGRKPAGTLPPGPPLSLPFAAQNPHKATVAKFTSLYQSWRFGLKRRTKRPIRGGYRLLYGRNLFYPGGRFRSAVCEKVHSKTVRLRISLWGKTVSSPLGKQTAEPETRKTRGSSSAETFLLSAALFSVSHLCSPLGPTYLQARVASRAADLD